MSPEARRILQVLTLKGRGENSFVGFSDFGDAIIWEAGSIRDQAARQAISYLNENNYIIESAAGLGLTKKGKEAVLTE